MATKTWAGALTGTLAAGAFNNAANWSPAVAPGAGDNLNMDVGWTGTTTIPTTNAALNFQDLTVGDTAGAANDVLITVAGTSAIWTVPAGGFINVRNNTLISSIYLNLTSNSLIKSGAGILDVGNTITGNSGILLQAGAIQCSITNGLGSATNTITMSDSTSLRSSSASATSQQTPLVINGNVILNSFSGSSTVLGTLTLSGSVALGGTTRTLNIGDTTTNSVTISGAISGTAGFTKAGTGNLTLTNTANTVSGTITANAGVLYFGPFASGTGSANVIPNVTAVTVAAQVWYNHYAGTSFNNSATFTDGGAGFLGITGATGWTGNGIVFSAGQLVGLGPVTPAADRGLYFFTNESFRNTVITVADFPTSVTLTSGAGVATTMSDIINVATGAAGGTYSTKFYINAGSSVLAHTWTLRLNANQTAASPIILQGGIERVNTANTMTTTFTLGGTNTQDNTISGSIIDISGKAIAITKADAGRWILSGANTYTGGVTVSAGTLSAQNAAALGSSATGAVSVTAGATLEAAFNGTINKASVGLTLNGTGVSSAGAISVPAGSIAATYSASAITLGSASSIGVGSGSSLTLGAVISGAFGLTKVAAGTLSLTNTGSSYTGKTTLSSGTLEITRIANSGTASSLGAPSVAGNITIDMAAGTTLKYSGTTLSTSDRSFNFTGPGSYTFESAGTAAMNLSGALTFASAGSNELVLTGTAAAGVTSVISSSAISNGSGTTSLTKNGSCRWRLDATGLTYTGNTTVNAGTLDLGSTADRSLSSNVVMAGGTLTNGAKSITPAASVTATTGSSTIESVIAGAGGTVTVNNGATLTLSPDTNLVTKTGTNTFTGNATVSAGGKAVLVTEVNAAAAGKGSVLGQSNTTTVAGTICTSPTGNQAGTARYNNLTFQAGAVLKLGFTS